MTTAPPDKTAAALRVLAADLERLTREVEAAGRRDTDSRRLVDEARESAASAHRAIQTLNEGVTRLAEQVRAATRSAVTASPTPGEQVSGRLYWLTIEDADTARNELADLIEWVGAVYLRFPGVNLQDCWTWHESVVTELHCLRAVWLEAIDGETGNAARLMDWHDRYRPGAATRVNAEMRDCYGLSEHLPTGKQAYRPPTIPGTALANDIAAWWAQTHGTRAAPPPSPAMLAEEKARASASTQARY